MPCVSPDGKPTESGMAMLAALNAGKSSPEDIAAETGRPLFRVRSGLRELLAAGLVSGGDEAFSLTEQGRKVL
jgi:DNA-binding IclR family transcriptional regulator